MSNSLATKGLLGDAIALATQGVLSSASIAVPVFICLHGQLVEVPTLGGGLAEVPTLGGGLESC